MHDDQPSPAASMIEAMNARAHVGCVITLSDGMDIDIEGIARRAFSDEDPEGRPVLVISVGSYDDAELHDLERDDHGYVVIPTSMLSNVQELQADEQSPARGWRLDYFRYGARVALSIEAREKR